MDDEVPALVTDSSCTSRHSFLSRVGDGSLAASLPASRVFKGEEMSAPNSADHGRNIPNTRLKWDVFVTPSIPVVTTDFAPGEHKRPWPPISSTLIHGSQDAVVVDSFITQ